MPILAAASVVGSLAKKVIPSHTIIGKAIGSTNNSKGIDLGKAASDAGFEKLGTALTSLSKLGTSPGKTSVAQSLTNVPASNALIQGNMTGGTSAASFQSTAPAAPVPGMAATGSGDPSPSGSGTEPAKDKMSPAVIAGLGLLAIMLLRK